MIIIGELINASRKTIAAYLRNNDGEAVQTLAQIVGFEDQNYLDQYLDGHSFRQLLENEEKPWKDCTVAEYLAFGVLDPMLLARRGKYKYVYVHNQMPLLFDLENDPEELENLIVAPELTAEIEDLHGLALGGMNVELLKQRIMSEQGRRNLVQKGMNCGIPPNWDHQPFFDAAKQYIRGINLTPYY